MTAYKVQFELPVDNPEKNVRRSRSQHCVTFYVPLNFPLIHTMTYDDFVAAAEISGLLHISTPLSNSIDSDQRSNIIKACEKEKAPKTKSR